MNEDRFWQIISLLAWDHTGDDNAVLAPAVAALAAYSEQGIFQFENILAEKLYRLDGVSYARNLAPNDAFKSDEEFFSVDTFLYVRCCVVANGRSLYERVLRDPTRMPKDMDFEPLLYLAENAYKLKTGGKEFPHRTPVSYETFSNRDQWKPK